MRIRKIHVHGFGGLEQRVFEDLGPKVIVFGPNESGKTSLRRFVYEILYGFEPASRERHPYAPWSGAELGGALEIELRSGETLCLTRRLLGTVRGDFSVNGAKSPLVNRPLPAVTAVNKKVYESIYTLAREDLEFPRETWGDVQDRMIGGSGLDGIRPAREVVSDLEGEANALWRPDRRKGPRAKELEERIHALGEAAKKARDRDREIRESRGKLEELRAERERVQEERIEIKAEIERLRELKKDRAAVDSICRDEETAGDIGAFDSLPADPRDFLKDRKERIGEWEETLREKIEKKAGADRDIRAFDDSLRRVMDRREEVGEGIDRGKRLVRDRESLEEEDRNVLALRKVLRERAGALLDRPDMVFDLPGIPAAEIEGRIDLYRNARQKRENDETTMRATPPPPRSPSLLPGVLLAGAGVALFAASFLFTPPARWIAWGAGFSSLIAGLILFVWSRRETLSIARDRALLSAREEELRASMADEAKAREEVRRSFGDLPVLPSLLEDPDQKFARVVRDLADALAGWRSAGAHAAERRREVEKGAEDLLSLAKEFSIESASPSGAVEKLEGLLQEAGDAQRADKQGRKNLEDLKLEIPRFEDRLRSARKERDELEEKLLSLGETDREACIAALDRRRRARANALEARERLLREGEDFEERVRKIRTATEEGIEEFSEEEILRREARKDEMDEVLRDLEGRIGALRTRLEAEEAEPSAAEIEGERLALREELAETCHERDRLVLLSAIVREGDRRYRAEHEPDIILRTKEHFAAISGGRYPDLFAPEGEGGLEVVPRGGDGPIPAGAPLSRGTLDQLFLSLRFALLEHLEGGGEALPLFLDEVFAHWDRERLERGLEILDRIAERRQVFLFTCHEPLFLRLLDRGATPLTLDPPSERGEAGGFDR
ncbi:MAG: AAA family ATPase [Candidatus Eisenbacteria bacterium]